MTTTVIVRPATYKGEPAVKLVSPYHPDLPAKAKDIGGRFATALNGEKGWYFDPRDEERVLALARDVYGTDGRTPVETVTIRVNLDSPRVLNGNDALSYWYEGREIARARGRDSGARLSEGVVLVEGRVGSAGSRNNPCITHKTGTVVEIRDVPLTPAVQADIDEGRVTVVDLPTLAEVAATTSIPERLDPVEQVWAIITALPIEAQVEIRNRLLEAL